VLAAFFLSITAGQASAQSENNFALGGEFSTRGLSDESARGHESIGLLWRFGQGNSGWGWHWGLNWYSADITQPVAGAVVPFGELHVRPVMIGYGYNYRRGRQLFSATMLGGYAFASMKLTPQATDAYYDRLGARSITLDTSNTFVVRPGLSVWHDVSRKVGLQVSAAFMVARPRATVLSTLGRDERRIRADMFQLKIGLAYSLF